MSAHTSRAFARAAAIDRGTPGPWRAIGATVDAPSAPVVTLRSGRHTAFRVCAMKDGELETVRANAALIAAAPDLLAALRECVDVLQSQLEYLRHAEDIDAIDHACAAIAKAEGRT